MTAGPPLQEESREELVCLLGEACELEHGLMCGYLYAQFSLNRTAGEGLTPEHLDRVQAWESALIGVIEQEMLHQPGRPGRRRAGRPVHPAGTERDADRHQRHQLRRAQPVPASPGAQHRAAGRRQPGLERAATGIGHPDSHATHGVTVIPAVN